MNCLISFTREMEEDINQERDNFQGLFYYWDMKQSNSIHRSEGSVPFVFLPCTLGFVLGSAFLSRTAELSAGVCSTPWAALGAAAELALPKRVWHMAGQLRAFLGSMFRKKGDCVPPIPSLLSSWQVRKWVPRCTWAPWVAVVIANNKDKPPPLGHIFAVNMLYGILQTGSAQGRITAILPCSC